jgi:pheromone shutdown-related protein TraB
MTNTTTYRDNVDLIELDGKKIYLVGTAHISQASVDLAETMIREVQPDSVAVELCDARHHSMKDAEKWKNTDIASVIRSGRAYVLLAQLLLAAFQKKLGNQLKVKPGAEMTRSIEVAEELGCTLILADRDIKITLKRVWASLGLWTLLKVLYSAILSVVQPQKITAEEVERLKSSDALESIMKEFTETFPEVREALISERDVYLAQKIRNAPGETVVAVMGAGHVPGIRRYIHETIDLVPLEVIPRKRLTTKLLACFIPLLIIGLVTYGFLGGDGGTGSKMAWSWIVITGAFTALGGILALAHPVTVVCAVLVSPFTTLNPFLRCGWIAALVEAILRKPRVADMENVIDDVFSLRGWYRNRVSRILLVMILVNLLGLVGSVVGVSVLASYL